MTVDIQSDASGEERFDVLADLLLKLGVYSSPAELHGLLCAKLASDANFSTEDWMSTAAVFLEQTSLSSAEAEQLLTAEIAITREQLCSAEFGLELVLPGDDDEVAARVESIGRWCVGFVAGIDRGKTGQLSEEARESLADLNEIANIEIPEDTQADEEQDLVEIIEYVRLAATMIFMEINPSQEAESENAPTIH